MTKKIGLLFFACLALLSCKEERSDLPDGLYAEIETSKGTIIVELEYTKAPVTVANFITLAEGKNPFASEKYQGKPFYDGLTFHRVVKGFMIQGGDPDANGSGGPGYKFKDEFSDLRHDKSGTLSMANAGPGTNGSQFFITHVPTEFLDGRHTVFGYVIGDGMKTVNAIANGDVIQTISIIRNGEAAKRFDALKTFRNYVATDEENQKKQALIDAENKKRYEEKYKAVIEAKVAEFAKIKAVSQKTSSGLQYKIIRKGNGKKPETGATILVHHAGFLENGELFDTNVETVAKAFGKFDAQRAAQMGYQPSPMKAGKKDKLIPGFVEGLEKLSIGDKAVLFIPANLGFGEQGAGNFIPPNANLIFEIEIMESK